MKIKKVCKICQAESEVIDAWAEWEEKKQLYILKDAQGNKDCAKCKGKCVTIDVDLDI